ncbi:ankyrin repeat domain-containing protein [Legionella quateirensis]|uniref:Ankyrin repeat protein n=1 Tax=Legionella quateirensis TaxID=45072 RepID=A0A378KWU8_9GAMM|nr:ankyrin repeat domain-containing protein [Legionella quateirensis]KTD50495.1 Ankyrin repeat protein [Legionella quateirensis]STY19045.1 Ankyrin repeat protein [Legionella quateirensis]
MNPTEIEQNLSSYIYKLKKIKSINSVVGLEAIIIGEGTYSFFSAQVAKKAAPIYFAIDYLNKEFNKIKQTIEEPICSSLETKISNALDDAREVSCNLQITAENALNIAIEQNDMCLFEAALSTNPNINKENQFKIPYIHKGNQFEIPLIMAAEHKRLDMLKELLAIKGIDINVANRYGTALHVLCKNYHRSKHREQILEIIRTFIDMRADVNAQGVDEYDQTKKSPLCLAVESGCIELVELLLTSKDIDINLRDEKFLPQALKAAVNHNFIDAVRLLLDKNAEVHHIHFYKACNKGYLPIAKMLYPKCIPDEKFNLEGALAEAIYGYQGNYDTIDWLLSLGADINTKMYSSFVHDYAKKLSPLSHSIISNNTALAQHLLENGADKEIAFNELGCTELYFSVATNDIAKVKQILKESTGDLEKKDKGGNTPLHCAVRAGNIELTELLIKAGADVNSKRNHCGTTVLHDAVINNNAAIVRQLLYTKGIDLHAYNFGNAYTIARKQKFTEIIGIFDDYTRSLSQFAEMINIAKHNIKDTLSQFEKYVNSKTAVQSGSATRPSEQALIDILNHYKRIQSSFESKDPDFSEVIKKVSQPPSEIEKAFELIHEDSKAKEFSSKLKAAIVLILLSLTGIGLFIAGGLMLNNYSKRGHALKFFSTTYDVVSKTKEEMENSVNLIEPIQLA